MAGTTGLEPATSAVTGQRSNQLSYVPNYAFIRPEVWFYGTIQGAKRWPLGLHFGEVLFWRA